MSNTSIAKKPASVLRSYTQQVRDHASAMQQATDHYYADLQRAERKYFAAVKRITDALNVAEEATTDEATSNEGAA